MNKIREFEEQNIHFIVFFLASYVLNTFLLSYEAEFSASGEICGRILLLLHCGIPAQQKKHTRAEGGVGMNLDWAG
jgi:hypothetical protein